MAKFVQRVLSSNRFFWVVTAIFTLSAVWVATASLYPMAFDEEFHFGLIKIYAAHWLPYGIENTRDMAQYGAAVADPSYLFHYLMSFPYRLLHALGLSEVAVIICLRLINIALVVASFVLYRKALLAANVPRATTHGTIAAFSLIPILPVMAGQLNYDNLLLVMVALSFWLIIRTTNATRKQGILPVELTCWLLGVLLITLPIKYAYLPIALGMGLWLVWLAGTTLRKQGFTTYKKHLLASMQKMHLVTKICLVVLIAAGVFFSARYVENYIRYDSAIPGCDAVFTEDACMDYGPWARNFEYKQRVDPNFTPISFPAFFITEWLPGMMQRLTFAVAGKTNDFQTKDPLPLVWPIASVFTSLGLLAFLLRARWLLKKYPYMAITLLVTLIYVGVLAVKLYIGYTKTSMPAAINGRYLLPLVPMLLAMCAQALLHVAAKWKVRSVTVVILATLFIVVVFQGGGVLTYIVQAEPHWFYPGWGQDSFTLLHRVVSAFTWRY